MSMEDKGSELLQDKGLGLETRANPHRLPPKNVESLQNRRATVAEMPSLVPLHISEPLLTLIASYRPTVRRVCREQRVTGIVIHLLIGLSTLITALLRVSTNTSSYRRTRK